MTAMTMSHMDTDILPRKKYIGKGTGLNELNGVNRSKSQVRSTRRPSKPRWIFRYSINMVFFKCLEFLIHHFPKSTPNEKFTISSEDDISFRELYLLDVKTIFRASCDAYANSNHPSELTLVVMGAEKVSFLGSDLYRRGLVEKNQYFYIFKSKNIYFLGRKISPCISISLGWLHHRIQTNRGGI